MAAPVSEKQIRASVVVVVMVVGSSCCDRGWQNLMNRRDECNWYDGDGNSVDVDGRAVLLHATKVLQCHRSESSSRQ